MIQVIAPTLVDGAREYYNGRHFMVNRITLFLLVLDVLVFEKQYFFRILKFYNENGINVATLNDLGNNYNK